ncbi:MAG: heparan-alpha-glucosaminide N-acetyltransferase [Archaeoglobaceae archaeon]
MRLWEIDFARGVAVVLMLFYHFLFDAQFFGKLSLEGEFWYFFPRFIGSMFIFISGYTLAVTKKSFRRILRKVAKLSAVAAFISFSTWLLFDEMMVWFGIIHFFAVATLLVYPLASKPLASLTAAFAAFAASTFLPRDVDTYSLLWLGLAPGSFATLDYYPLLPYVGFMFLGASLGNFHRTTGLSLRDPISLLGRNSLKVYLIQHPLIVAILCLIYPDIFNDIVELYEDVLGDLYLLNLNPLR